MIVLVSEVKLCYNEDRFRFCDNFDDFAEQTLKFQTQNSINKYQSPFPSWNFQDVFSDSDKQTFVV